MPESVACDPVGSVIATDCHAFGAVLGRPVASRLAHVVPGGTALLLLELALPVPPWRPMLGLLGDDHPAHLAGPLAVVAIETAVLSVALVAVAIRLTRQCS